MAAGLFSSPPSPDWFVCGYFPTECMGIFGYRAFDNIVRLSRLGSSILLSITGSALWESIDMKNEWDAIPLLTGLSLCVNLIADTHQVR